MKSLKENLIEILIQNKLVTQQQLDNAIEIQKKKRISLRRVLVEEKIISEEELLSLLSNRLYVPTLHLTKYRFDKEIIGFIPKHLAVQYNVVPLSKMGKTITVAIADPLNIFAIDDLRIITGCEIDIVLSPEEEILKAIESQYGSGEKNMDQILKEDFDLHAEDKLEVELLKSEEIELSSVLKESEKPLIVKIVDLMLTEALKKRASDLHIEPEIDGLRIRYRIDGHRSDKTPLTTIFLYWRSCLRARR